MRSNVLPPSLVCRTCVFCTGCTGFCLNLLPSLKYLSEYPSEVISGGSHTCSSQADNGCPQQMSPLTNLLCKSGPLPVATDLKTRAPLLWAHYKWCHWGRLWSSGISSHEFTTKLGLLNLSVTEESWAFLKFDPMGFLFLSCCIAAKLWVWISLEGCFLIFVFGSGLLC